MMQPHALSHRNLQPSAITRQMIGLGAARSSTIATDVRVLVIGGFRADRLRAIRNLLDVHRPGGVVLLGHAPAGLQLGAIRPEPWRLWSEHFAAIPMTYIQGPEDPEGIPIPDRYKSPWPNLEPLVLRLVGAPTFGGFPGWPLEGLRLELDYQLQKHPFARIILSRTPPLGCQECGEGHEPLAEFLASEGGSAVSLVLCGSTAETVAVSRCGQVEVVQVGLGCALLEICGAHVQWRVLEGWP